MTNKPQCEIGMVGLGVMGRNLLLNIADHGFTAAGYDNDRQQADSLRQEAQGRDIHATANVQEFMQWLRRPRAIVVLVPAGSAVDAVIKALSPWLEPGDLIIDAGNSWFKDTNTRATQLAAQGIQFLGVGVSGGEEGARHGPSIMVGGPKEAWQRVQPVFEAIAAKVNNEPCVAWLGTGSAGHFVKMVHNGIEYGIMQLISETYNLMKQGMELNNKQLQEVYSEWNQGELSSYLLEITSNIFAKIDDITGKALIDLILPVARQKGTGMWTSQTALELQVPTPTIDIAVMIRDVSGLAEQREQTSRSYSLALPRFSQDCDSFLLQLRHALFASTILVYSQGMSLLAAASQRYQYQLNLADVARIWRGGCIIRSAFLEDIRAAFQAAPDLPTLLLDSSIAHKLTEHQEGLRQVVTQSALRGVPVPALMVSLAYFDFYRSAWLPANLIQAQRDYFGAHTYQRIDKPGTFHTEWEKS